MSNRIKLITAILFASSALLFIACGPTANNDTAKPTNTSATSTPQTNDVLAADRELYKTNCAQCHQANGTGGKTTIDGKEINAKDLTSERMKNRPDKKLTEDISEGSPDDGMPSFKTKLSDAEIERLVHYIRVELQKTP